MKNRKKTTYIWAITLVIAGLMITVSASAIMQTPMPEEKTKLELMNVESGVAGMDIAMSKSVERQFIDSTSDPLIGDPVLIGAHPTVSSDIISNVVLGFELAEDPSNVYFTASPDQGSTWNDMMVGWGLPEPPELPCVDTCGDGRVIGGMVPNWEADYGSQLYKPVATDPNNIPDGWGDLSYWSFWDLGDGYSNFVSVACGGYTSGDATEDSWAFGAHSMVGDHGGAGGLDTNFFSYQMTEDGYAWIYHWGGAIGGCEVTGMDIDQDTLYAYAVWNFNNSGTMDLYAAIFDFGVWETEQGYPIHPGVGSDKTISSAGNDNYFDVSAYKDNVIIISERDGDIICYYSSNALGSISEVTIETGGENPKVVHTGEYMAACEFIKDGTVYYSLTEDGGATWSTPEAVDGSDNVVEENNAADICGYGAAWMDDEDTIYFQFLDIMPDYPFLEITDISGGLGVTATIANTGDAPATNVAWEIEVTGGLLGGIDVNASGTESSLAVGADLEAKTGIFLGFGAIDIEVSVTCDEGFSAQATTDGIQIIIFTKVN